MTIYEFFKSFIIENIMPGFKYSDIVAMFITFLFFIAVISSILSMLKIGGKKDE